MMKKLAIALLTLLLVYLQTRLWIGEGSVAEMLTQQDNLERFRLENERLYQRNRLLAKEVVELQQGLETVEERARQELGMIRSDETFFLTYD
ncbi:septum formation initiator family protein [Salinisphaera sp. G21_0]|uniref:septum formation initiator family protein n=2 Tax=Gammaproteobacteria TaxID=1236 RepID=UPI001ADB9FB3|nr:MULTISPECIES: septum formation initiator family protein [Gammaproteobacteria]MBO9480249.1 septum formation initiator family protein [Salinisphaera sp. G21_0]MBO9493496.1 septum formation initiator family protein [Thalassotalea sp. G20_0]